jgi:hypothetical protein
MRDVFNIHNVPETRQYFHRTGKEPIQLSPLEQVMAMPPREPHGISTMLLTLPPCFPNTTTSRPLPLAGLLVLHERRVNGTSRRGTMVGNVRQT